VAPAGYGKTTTVQVAAAVQQAAGRPVVAVAPTNQAVHELRAVGLTASTIARLRIDLQHDRLPPGTVLVVDEISQVATADAVWLLDTAANVPGGELWLLGDSRQTGPVRAGGFVDREPPPTRRRGTRRAIEDAGR
jgi:ATP-dependent exoDNAse (exonuclease V) alpha subunit